jgi:hypothetical protein
MVYIKSFLFCQLKELRYARLQFSRYFVKVQHFFANKNSINMLICKKNNVR